MLYGFSARLGKSSEGRLRISLLLVAVAIAAAAHGALLIDQIPLWNDFSGLFDYLSLAAMLPWSIRYKC